MKIAIIGAGLAGLSCAHELEKYGVSPVIIEDLNFIGDRENHISATLNVVDRPIKDILKYYKNVCHLDISPLNVVKKLTHYSPGKKMVVKSNNLGYFFRRGKESYSFKEQIFSQLSNTKIIFSQKPDYKELSKEYDFVVVATGLPDVARDLGIWEELIGGWIKGATVEGEFDPTELIMWISHKYCKNGYAYLCPFDTQRATLALFVPFVDKRKLDYYWDRFLYLEKIKYPIVEKFAIEHFSGFVNPHRAGNIFFVGNAGGGLSPLLGFGQVNAIIMGVFAAQSIIEGLDYETLIKPVLDKEAAFYEIRKFFDSLTDNGYNIMLNVMGAPGFKQLEYYTNVNVIKHFATILRLKNKLLYKENFHGKHFL